MTSRWDRFWNGPGGAWATLAGLVLAALVTLAAIAVVVYVLATKTTN